MDLSALLEKQAKLAEANIAAATAVARSSQARDATLAASMAVDKLMTLHSLVHPRQ